MLLLLRGRGRLRGEVCMELALVGMTVSEPLLSSNGMQYDTR